MPDPICAWCGEPVLAVDEKPLVGGNFVMHFECGLRSVAGSLAHLRMDCSCFHPESDKGDPPELTKRQAAKLVAVEWAIVRGRPSCA